MQKRKENTTLSERELNILKLIKEILTNEEIATRLHISIHTVKVHINGIYRKLNARNRLEAVLTGIKKGYLTL